MDFTVIHEHHLGWSIGEGGEGFFGEPAFPYGLDPHGTNRLNALAVKTEEVAAKRESAATWRSKETGWAGSAAGTIATMEDMEADRLQGIIDDELVPDADLLDQESAFEPYPEEAYGAAGDTASDANANAELSWFASMGWGSR